MDCVYQIDGSAAKFGAWVAGLEVLLTCQGKRISLRYVFNHSCSQIHEIGKRAELTIEQTINGVLGERVVCKLRELSDEREAAIQGGLAADVSAVVKVGALRGVDGCGEWGSAVSGETVQTEGFEEFVQVCGFGRGGGEDCAGGEEDGGGIELHRCDVG